MKKKIESYQGAAGGWGAVKSVANAVRKQMDIRQDVIAIVVFSRSPARIIWLLKVMETFTNATILSIHSTKLETLINLNSKR